MKDNPRLMLKKGRNEMWVGMFVILALIFLTVIVFFVSGVYLFRPGYSLFVRYDYVSILDKGSPVRMAGVRVGEVTRVRLMPDESTGDVDVEVKLFLDKDVTVRDQFLFQIRGTHVLSEPHIEITPRPGNGPRLEDGARIIGHSPVALEDLIGEANEIAVRIEEILSVFSESLGDEEGKRAVRGIVVNLAKLTESLSLALDGSEEELKAAVRDIHASASALSGILQKIESGEGSAGKLIMEEEFYQELQAFVAEIKAHPWKLLRKESERKKFLGIL